MPTSSHSEAMKLPVMPPISPMLAKSVSAIPPGASCEPKWDGFRSICFRDGEEVELGRTGHLRHPWQTHGDRPTL